MIHDNNIAMDLAASFLASRARTLKRLSLPHSIQTIVKINAMIIE